MLLAKIGYIVNMSSNSKCAANLKSRISVLFQELPVQSIELLPRKLKSEI